MYVIMSMLDGRRVMVAENQKGQWTWDRYLTHVKMFKSLKEARYEWVTHRNLMARTDDSVTIEELILHYKETLE